MADTSVFHKQKNFGDLIKLDEEFALRKQQAVQQAQLGGLQMQKLQKEIETGVSTNDPSSVREYQYYSALPETEKQDYLTMKRAQQWRDVGDAHIMPDPLNPNHALATLGKGIEPDRKITADGRIITMPSVPGTPRGLPQGQYVDDIGAVPINLSDIDRDIAGSQQDPMQASRQAIQNEQSRIGVNPMQRDDLQGVNIQELPKSMEDVEKEQNRQKQKAQAGGTVIQDINRAINMIENNPGRTTGFGGYLKGIPLTDAKAVAGFIESSLSNVGLDTLQTMRENSPTGGALGQVPIQQQKRLEQVLGSLDMTQDTPIVLDNLRRVSNIYMDIVYGTQEEIANLANQGVIDFDRAQELMHRHPLSFDEFGNPVDGQQSSPASTTEAAQIEFSLRNKGFTPEQINQYMKQRGLK